MRLGSPSVAYRVAFLEMARECADAGDARYESAIADFDGYVRTAIANADVEGLPGGRVPSLERWFVSEGVVAGCARIRLRMTPLLEHEGGHVGYDVRPSLRRLGHGTELLRLALVEARAHGLVRVLVTCDEDNVASAKVIEHNGGVLVGRATCRAGGRIRRYWIG